MQETEDILEDYRQSKRGTLKSAQVMHRFITFCRIYLKTIFKLTRIFKLI